MENLSAVRRYTGGIHDSSIPNSRSTVIILDMKHSCFTNRSFRGFGVLRIGAQRYPTCSVAVPSRVPKCCEERPQLQGLRIIVKYRFRMKVLRNTMENAAFYDVDEPAIETASNVQALLDAGDAVLGMAKLSSFAGREEPSEYVDYQLPFNTRGDGYQSPAGSSNGSAVAVASYKWVDVGIGTDSESFTHRLLWLTTFTRLGLIGRNYPYFQVP